MAKKCDICDGGACRDEKPIKVSFCPKCKSTKVKYVFGVGNLFGVIPRMRCDKCGNELPSFPLLVTNKKLLSAAGRGKFKKGAKK